MANSVLLRRAALSATLFAFGVIALGALTRLMDAGLGCPDWPGCYGHLTVVGAEQAGVHLVAYKAWAEMIHRYFVAGLSVLIILIVTLVLGRSADRRRVNVILASALMLLLVYQILLGQLTVSLKLLPAIVSQHLLGGFLILSTLWTLYLCNKPAVTVSALPAEKKLLPWALVALGLVFLQISLGAWTSTNYASLSCPDFPFCLNAGSVNWQFKEAFTLLRPLGVNYEGGVLSEAARQTIQICHRFGALFVTTYLVLFLMCASRVVTAATGLMKSIYLIIALLCVQLALGISNVIFKLPLVTAVCHNLVAALLLLSIITLSHKIATLKRKEACV